MILLIILGFVTQFDSVITDFTTEKSLKNWYTVDDVVMGGRSDSQFVFNEKGDAVFSGSVSLENNGGFSSLRHDFEQRNVASFNTISLHLKGDGNRYQFRVKSKRTERYSYVYYFNTSGTWEWIDIPLSEMYPVWRGNRLDQPDYPGQILEEIGILIGNNKPEEFKMEIKMIRLK